MKREEERESHIWLNKWELNKDFFRLVDGDIGKFTFLADITKLFQSICEHLYLSLKFINVSTRK